jgi:hypothetical protein
VNVLFNVDPDMAAGAQAFPGLEVTQDTIARQYENFELFLNLRALDGGLQIEAQYNTDLYDEESVQRWLDMFECVLRSAVRTPGEAIGRLEVLSAEAVRSLIAVQPRAVALDGAPLAHAGFMARGAAATASSMPCPTAWRARCVHAACAAASAWACAWSAAWRRSSRWWPC